MDLGSTPWVDRTWRGVWDRVGMHVPDTWLPDVRSGKKFSVHEYGTGSWGAVSPTNDDQLVVKLTTDLSEALFVAWAMRAGMPMGSMTYHRIYKLANVTRRRRDVYVLWRNEAYEVGNFAVYANALEDHNQTQAVEALDQAHLLRKIMHLSSAVRTVVRRRRKTRTDASFKYFLDELWQMFQSLPELGIELVDMPFLATDYIRLRDKMLGNEMAIPHVLNMIWCLLNALSTRTYLGNVGHALTFYMDQGVLLADVHSDNIGRSWRPERDWIITDPGHAVVLNPAIAIPPIDSI